MSAHLNSQKPDFITAMARLREIANTSADDALTEGPVNADRHLLGISAPRRGTPWYMLKGRTVRGIGAMARPKPN
jgi:hypothetical protein